MFLPFSRRFERQVHLFRQHCSRTAPAQAREHLQAWGCEHADRRACLLDSMHTGVYACSIPQQGKTSPLHRPAAWPRGTQAPPHGASSFNPLEFGQRHPFNPTVRKNKGARLPWRRLVPKREAAMATIQLAFALAVAAATCAPGAHAFQGPLLAVRAAATARPCRQGRVSVSMSGFGGFAKTKKDTFKYTGSQRLSVPTPRRKVPDSVVSDHK